MRHDTPYSVAKALTKHIPKSINNLLDPSVGAGGLLKPIVHHTIYKKIDIFCVDSDAGALRELKENFVKKNIKNLKLINEDFLIWSGNTRLVGSFDCVLMNPPFSGRNFISLNIDQEMSEEGIGEKRIPIEAAFLVRSVNLLKPGGRLLAVLPGSIVMSERLKWLRQVLFKKGAIRYVHELPENTFPNVESRMYLLIFDKGRFHKNILLLNHDLSHPKRLKISRECVNKESIRLDFCYQRAIKNLKLLEDKVQLGWRKFESVSSVIRGNFESPKGPKSKVHTTDFKNGFWHRSKRHKGFLAGDFSIRDGDILVKRVGRDSYMSFGKPVGLNGMGCSDCVFILRPNLITDSLKLLFALKCLFQPKWSKALIESGTGATYISENSLKNLMIPFGLHRMHSDSFDDFTDALLRGDIEEADKLVKTVAEKIYSPR